MSVSSNEIGDLLIDLGLITSEQLSEAVKEQESSGNRLTVVLSEMGLVSERQLKDALELQYGVNFVNLSNNPPADEFVQLVPEDVQRKYRFVPVSQQGAQYTVAMVDPDDLIAADAVRLHLRSGNFKKLVCTADDFEYLMHIAYDRVAEEEEAAPESDLEETQEEAAFAPDEELHAVPDEVDLEPLAASKSPRASQTNLKAHMRNLFEADSDDDLDAMFNNESSADITQEDEAPAVEPKAQPKKSISALFSDDEEEEASTETAETAKTVDELPSSPSTGASALFDDGDDDFETPETKPPSTASSLFGADDDDFDAPDTPPPSKPVASSGLASLFSDGDDDDMETHKPSSTPSAMANLFGDPDDDDFETKPAAQSPAASLFGDDSDDDFESESNTAPAAGSPLSSLFGDNDDDLESALDAVMENKSSLTAGSLFDTGDDDQDFEPAPSESLTRNSSLFGEDDDEDFETVDSVPGESLTQPAGTSSLFGDDDDLESLEPQAEVEESPRDSMENEGEDELELEEALRNEPLTTPSLFGVDDDDEDFGTLTEEPEPAGDEESFETGLANVEPEALEEEPISAQEETAGDEEAAPEAPDSMPNNMLLEHILQEADATRSKTKKLQLFDDPEADDMFADSDNEDAEPQAELAEIEQIETETEPEQQELVEPDFEQLEPAAEEVKPEPQAEIEQELEPEPEIEPELEAAEPEQVLVHEESQVEAEAEPELPPQDLDLSSEPVEPQAPSTKKYISMFDDEMEEDELFGTDTQPANLVVPVSPRSKAAAASEKARAYAEEEADLTASLLNAIDSPIQSLFEPEPLLDDEDVEEKPPMILEPSEEVVNLLFDENGLKDQGDDAIIKPAFEGLDDEEMDEDSLFASASHSILREGAPQLRDLLSRFEEDESPSGGNVAASSTEAQQQETAVEPVKKEAELAVSALLAALDDQMPEEQSVSALKRNETPESAEGEDIGDNGSAIQPTAAPAASPKSAGTSKSRLRVMMSSAEETDMDAVAKVESQSVASEDPEVQELLATNADIIAKQLDAELEDAGLGKDEEQPQETPEPEPIAETTAADAEPPAEPAEAPVAVAEEPRQQMIGETVPPAELPAIPSIPDALDTVLPNVTSEIRDSVELTTLSGNRTEISFLEEIVESELALSEDSWEKKQEAPAPEPAPVIQAQPDPQPVDQPVQAQPAPQPVPVPQADPAPVPVAAQTPQPTMPAEHALIPQVPSPPTELDPSILNLATQILTQAVNSGCTDVHFEPVDDGLALRFMASGELLDETILPQQIQAMLILCLKSMAGLDPLVADRPQDKKFVTTTFGTPIEMRITSLPVRHGEMVAVSLKA